MTNRAKPLLGELIPAYLADRTEAGAVTANSARTMRSVLARFLVSVGDRPPKSLKTAHIERWLASEDSVSHTTRRARLSVVRTFCRWMVTKGHIAADPTAPIHLPPKKRRLRRAAAPPPAIDTDLLAAFRDHQQRRQLSPATVDGRHRALVEWALFLHPKPVAEADRDDIEAWVNPDRLSTSSMYTYLSTLRTFYDFLEREGVRASNPARRVPPPRLPRYLPRPIPDADLRIALKGADARMRAWLCLGAYQGLRCAEMAAQRREDLFLDRSPPMMIVTAGKGRRQRLLALNPFTETALRVHGLPTTGRIFKMSDGRPLRGSTISSYMGRYFRGLGIEGSAHMLRHWFGTKTFAATKDLRITQELLGHADSKTTSIYVGWSDGDATEAVRGLNVELPRLGSGLVLGDLKVRAKVD